MGGWNSKGKVEANGLKKIRLDFLKKYGYLNGGKSGAIEWASEWSENKSSVGLETSINGDIGHLRIYYTQTKDDGEKTNFDYKIPLTSTPCRYGGRRYWFICPMSRNEKYCGRRVGVLYKNGDLFACRHCYRLTYATQNYGGRYKGFVSVPDIEKAEAKVGRQYYRGRPTRKYRRVLKLNEQFEMGFLMMASSLEKRYKGITKKRGGGRNKQ